MDLLLSWVLLGTALLILYCVNLWFALRAPSLELRWRLLALVPPAAPFFAWVAGRRVAPVMFAVVAGGYGILRLVSS